MCLALFMQGVMNEQLQAASDYRGGFIMDLVNNYQKRCCCCVVHYDKYDNFIKNYHISYSNEFLYETIMMIIIKVTNCTYTFKWGKEHGKNHKAQKPRTHQ